MDIVNNLKKNDGSLWDQVLRPERVQVSNDVLGYKYILSKESNAYQRRDGKVTTQDNLELKFTCYLRVNSSNNNLNSDFSFSGLNYYDEFEEHVPSITSIDGRNSVFFQRINSKINLNSILLLNLLFFIFILMGRIDRKEGFWWTLQIRLIRIYV